MDDEKKRSRQLRQPHAFRKVFCELALNKNFEPIACQGCLTDHVIPFEPHDNWQDDIKGWNMRKLRFCLDCAVEHANAIKYRTSRSIAYVSIEELSKYCVEPFIDYPGEGPWCNVVEHLHSLSGTYVLLDDANRLCLLRQNLSLKDLQSAQLPQSSLRANVEIYDFAARVAKNIVKLHQLPIWSEVELGDNDESFEFWSEAISWAKSRGNTENIDVSKIALDDPTIATLAEKYWEDFISTHLQRVLKDSVVGKFHVTLSGLHFFDQEPQVNPLIRATIHYTQLHNLCVRIHGKTPEQVLLDDTEVFKRRLNNYEVYMLAFIRLTGMVPAHLLEIIIDLVVCITPELFYNSSDNDALGSFFTYFLTVAKTELNFMS